MSITDEDLMYVADAMWQDTLLPDLPGKGSTVPEPEPIVETEADVEVEASPNSKNQDSGASRANKIEWKRPSKPKSSISPLTDLYLSSPAPAIQSTKARSKVNKSMKGASQNERPPRRAKKVESKTSACPSDKLAALAHSSINDPYSVPISPISTRHNHKTVTPADTVRRHIPATASSMKPSSPSLAVQQYEKKLDTHRQKRVAKRSFLDQPETSSSEVVTRTVQQPKLELKAVPGPSRTTKQEKIPAKKQTAKKPIKTEDTDAWAPPVQNPEHVLPIDGITKNLRPRGERAPIIISSDPATSSEDDDSTDVGFAPESSFSSPPLPGTTKKQPVSTGRPEKSMQKVTGKSAAKPVEQSSKQESQETEKDPDTRGTEERKMEKMLPVQKHNTQQKRMLPANSPLQNDGRAKKQRSERATARPPKAMAAAAAPVRNNNIAHMRPPLPKLRTGRITPLSSALLTEDPFIANVDEDGVLQTQFTSKLLQSAAQPTQEMSDGITRQMMQLLADGTNAAQLELQKHKGKESAKQIWLSESDPYKKTGQIMGFVCKSILRFLKSKEEAVNDVVNEYLERGNAVLARIRKLHESEKHDLLLHFEKDRVQSLKIFEAAHGDVHALTTKLESVNLVPVINDVLADDAAARLRALEVKMA